MQQLHCVDNYSWIQSEVTVNTLYTLNPLLYYILKLQWEDNSSWIQILI